MRRIIALLLLSLLAFPSCKRGTTADAPASEGPGRTSAPPPGATTTPTAQPAPPSGRAVAPSGGGVVTQDGGGVVTQDGGPGSPGTR